VYFAEKAEAAGVLFLSNNRAAHLETLGPESVHQQFIIPSYVVPSGILTLEEIRGKEFQSIQFPTILNGVASETIGEYYELF
jgi:hypothetical protein